MKDPRVYVVHAREWISRIERYAAGGESSFMGSDLIQDAVIRNVQTLAQSVSQLPTALKDAHPEIDWRGISGFRNVLVHDYLGVSAARVWQIVVGDLPQLEQSLVALLQDLDSRS
jgi:uncharacterized protein with HEPN domain